jgi:hypothetical protein
LYDVVDLVEALERHQGECDERWPAVADASFDVVDVADALLQVATNESAHIYSTLRPFMSAIDVDDSRGVGSNASLRLIEPK